MEAGSVTCVVSDEEVIVGLVEVEDGGGVSEDGNQGNQGEQERHGGVVEHGLGHERSVALLKQLSPRVEQ